MVWQAGDPRKQESEQWGSAICNQERIAFRKIKNKTEAE